MRGWRCLARLFAVLALPASALAEDPVAEEIPASLRMLSDQALEARLADAIETLDYGETYADVWWYGWTGFYALGAIIQTVAASTNDHDSDGRTADKVVGAVKAAGGVAGQLLRPSTAADGADPVRALPDRNREDRLRRLMIAEDRLRRRARESDQRYSLLRHGLNVGINVTGALIVWQGFDEKTRAWRSAGVGIAVGEVMLWSQPWWGRSDLEAYDQRNHIRIPPPVDVSWHLVPTTGGAALMVRF